MTPCVSHLLLSQQVKLMTEKSIAEVGLSLSELFAPEADRRSYYWGLMNIIVCVYNIEKAPREGGTWERLFGWADAYDRDGGTVKVYVEKQPGTLGQLLTVQDTAPRDSEFALLAEITS